MSDIKKPVDLAAVRARIVSTQVSVNAVLYHDVPAIADELETTQTEVAYLRRREADIIEACEHVADGGQYRADIVSAIQRIRRERDDLRAAVRNMVARVEAGEIKYGDMLIEAECLKVLLPPS